MKIVNLSKIKPLEIIKQYLSILDKITIDDLKAGVDSLSYPRDFYKESKQNKKAGLWIFEQFKQYGYTPEFQGKYNNIVASILINTNLPYIIVGAHYDSVPGTPGADDNASAVIAMLQSAKSVFGYNFKCNILFIAFNLEEHGLLGSQNFVNEYVLKNNLKIKNVHILEMVGYTSSQEQKIPSGLPIKLQESSDFLGLISNKKSNRKMNLILAIAKSYLNDFNVLGLKVYCSLEKIFHHLERSDHASFWDKNIPAMMWTDTSEFRNPHYHQASDLPETLDYAFLCNTTKLLTLVLLIESTYS